MLHVTPSIAIDDSEIEERFIRSSGPGGQNVNKVATAVQLRFDVDRSSAIDDEVRERLKTIAGSRMTETFFAGSPSKALLGLIDLSGDRLSDDDFARLSEWVAEQARTRRKRTAR